jgi:hypothetical protein
MAYRMFSRRTGLAIAAGCFLFSALAAANVRPEDMSVSQIEEQLQVRKNTPAHYAVRLTLVELPSC